MTSMNSALGTNRPIAVKAKIGQLLLRVGLAHIKMLLCFSYCNIAVRVGWICRLRYWSVGVRVVISGVIRYVGDRLIIVFRVKLCFT